MLEKASRIKLKYFSRVNILFNKGIIYPYNGNFRKTIPLRKLIKDVADFRKIIN